MWSVEIEENTAHFVVCFRNYIWDTCSKVQFVITRIISQGCCSSSYSNYNFARIFFDIFTIFNIR